MKGNSFYLQFLGQTGFKINVGKTSFLIDPYLSNSIAENENSKFKRLQPIPVDISKLTDINGVFITHTHLDHCDEETLIPLSLIAPSCKFYGPPPVIEKLHRFAINNNNLVEILEKPFELDNDILVTPVPSAHPKVIHYDTGGFEAIGYIIQTPNITLYHAGDTCLTDLVILSVKKFSPIDIAMIPVNESNYFKNQQGIIGNMSVREAFIFAEVIKAKYLIPTHWDMFSINSVYKEEIQLIYDKKQPPFDLIFNGNEISGY